MRGQHPQDVALGAVIDGDDVMPWHCLPSIAALRHPRGLVPLVGLAASDLFSEIHPFETGPFRRLHAQRRDVERAERVVGDHTIGRPLVANEPGQPPGVDTGNADQLTLLNPAIE